MKTIYETTITNTCTCTVYEETTGEYTEQETDTCYGDCWGWAVEDFTNITEALRDSNETNWWKVEDLRLWNGNVGGFFHADNAEDLLYGMTVRAEWRMVATVFDDRIEYSLSHHDSPTGSSTVIRPVTEQQREEWGLY